MPFEFIFHTFRRYQKLLEIERRKKGNPYHSYPQSNHQRKLTTNTTNEEKQKRKSKCAKK